MTKASDNAFPSILITEGTEPAAPAAGKQRLYIDSTTHLLKRTDSSGTDVTIEGGSPSGSITASGYTQTTARLLGRTTASTGAIEEITVGSGLSLSAGALTATGGSGGALVFLETHTASSSATLDFTSFISGTYDDYMFEFVNVLPATNAVGFYMRMGTGGGPTYDAGTNYASTDYRWVPGGSATSGASSGLTQIILTNQSGTDTLLNTANYGLSGTCRLSDPGSAVYKKVTAQTSWENTGSVIEGSVISGSYLSTTAVTAVRFLMSSGNIASGIIRVYGFSKS